MIEIQGPDTVERKPAKMGEAELEETPAEQSGSEVEEIPAEQGDPEGEAAPSGHVAAGLEDGSCPELFQNDCHDLVSEPETAQKYDVQGSTQYVAQVIQDKTGADIFRIERQVDYPTDHDALTDQAQSEREQGVHPAIKDTIGDLSRYDTIFLGYPIWWYDAPMPVYTFLDNYDLSGKQVYVFATHGGSGLTGTVERLQAAEPGAQFGSSAFAVYRTDIASTSPIYAWLGNLGYK